MRQLLGSGQAPEWPQPQFGDAVPPVTTWQGDASDRATTVSTVLDRRRQSLANANSAVAPIVKQVETISATARTQLDAIIQQWDAYKKAFEPIANTTAGKVALLQLGELCVSQGAQVINNAQAAFAGAAGQVHGLTAQLPAQVPGHTSSPGQAGQGQPPNGEPHIQAAGFGTGDPPQSPYDHVGPQLIDPHNPLIGDERFGHWTPYTPLPYTGDKPPPPEPYHVSADGLPAKTGGPSGFYVPGKTWVDDSQAPFADLAEEYKFRISGWDMTSYTRTVMVDGQPQLQRWAANTYESQRITRLDIGGSAWAKTAPDALEGTLGGVTTGGLAGIGGTPFFGQWQPTTPQQIAVLSDANPTVTYYIPDGCGGQFTFQGGVPVGGMAPPPMIPIMTRAPGS